MHVDTESDGEPPDLAGHGVWLSCWHVTGGGGTEDVFGFAVSDDGVIERTCHGAGS